MKKRVYSGVRATGRLHLGNYMGAVKGMLALQDDDAYECIFSVVDLHAMTTPYDPKILKTSVENVILDYLAAGLDSEKCLLEIQSAIPQHTELSYLLSTIYSLAKLEDLPTFREKRAQHPEYVNLGLVYYPILMAADILLYKAELIPVGIDQEPHLEVAREVARKFNQMFGETFPQPRRFKTPGEYIPSLLGKGKMSKSIEGSYITLSDTLETIKKKIAKIPTDSGAIGGKLPSEGGVANLFTLTKLFAGEEVAISFEREYEQGVIRYGDMKATLCEAVMKELTPLQEKRAYFEAHPEIVKAIIDKSTQNCLDRATQTLTEVKQKMGLL